MGPSADRLGQLVIGEDRTLTAGALAWAGLLFLFAAAVSRLAYDGYINQRDVAVLFRIKQVFLLEPFWDRGLFPATWVYGYLLVGGIATIHAFFNEGYLPTLVLSASPLIGGNLWRIHGMDEYVALAPPAYMVVQLIPRGLVVATLGFAFGVGLRRVARSTSVGRVGDTAKTEPIQLTPAGLETLLKDMDHAAFVAFVIELYERMGWETERNGRVITASKDGISERLLVWTDDRTAVERTLGTQPELPERGSFDTIITRQGSGTTPGPLSEETGAQVLDLGELHDRLLYGIDRESCRELCRRHFDRDIDPRAATGGDQPNGLLDTLSQSQALLAISLCGLIVVGAASIAGMAHEPAPGTEAQPEPEGTGETSLVTPVNSGLADSGPASIQTVKPPAFALGDDQQPKLNVTKGSTFTLTGQLTNQAEFTYTNISLSLADADQNYTVATVPLQGTSIERLEPGTSQNVSWVVTVGDLPGGEHPMTLSIEYEREDGDRRHSVNRTYTITVFSRFPEEPPNVSVAVNDGPARPGSTTTLTVTLENTVGKNFTDVGVVLVPPAEAWNVTALNGTTVESVAQGESWSVSWAIEVPESARGEYSLRGSYSYKVPDSPLRKYVNFIDRITVTNSTATATP